MCLSDVGLFNVILRMSSPRTSEPVDTQTFLVPPHRAKCDQSTMGGWTRWFTGIMSTLE